MDMIKFFITWGPTFLFLVIVLFGILVGFIRGFRKSLILFIQMLIAGVICLIVYLCIVNNPNLDSNMVGFINGILGKFGTSLQNILSANDECTTLHAMLMQNLTSSMSSDELPYLLIIENAAYINTLVDMAYHLVIAILCFILYFILVFFFYLIYLIAYPVRRKIKKENRKYQNGEINHPYKRRRLLGGLVGGVRATLTAVICFSFLGSLIFIVTGGTNLPQRDEIKEEGSVEFQDQTWNEVYDYYSYVCAMGNTGIFQVLNSMKDTGNTPFYFYFADIVLQGRINDENLGVENEKFYLRDEMGEYVHFINSTLALVLKYGNPEDLEALVNNADSNRQMDILMSTMGNEGFAEEFSKLIDEFEGKPFMTNLCLSSLTSLVNHIDIIVDDEKVIGLVNQLFKSEDAIKVTDLATEADIKNLFKGLVQVVVEVNKSQNEVSPLSEGESQNHTIVSTKRMILIAKNLVPTIQELSLFNDRSAVGEKIIKGLYTYASTSLITDEKIEFEVPDNIVWIDEFNILLNACEPLLSIAYEIYDDDTNIMIENFAYIFERENAEEMEAAFDDLALQLESSLLLDVVFKSSIVGEQIDNIVVEIANDENAKIPKNIDYVGKDGECSILFSAIKILLKNGGGPVLLTMMNISDEGLQSEQIKEMLEVLTKEITVDGKTTTLIKNVIKSKLVYYILSTYLIYADFGDGNFKLYLPEDVIEMNEDCKLIKYSEIEIIVDLLSNCVDLIVEVMDNPTDLDYAHIFSNEYIEKTVKESILLQGTLANIIIGVSATEDITVLPYTFDKPESWISKNGDGEICVLLDAIVSVSSITLEDDKYLINELLNGNIQPSALLTLEKKTLDQLCSSKVLRYTISDMVTNLDGFQIVVPRASLEEVNALTTTDKLVNVIKATELCDIFVDIQKIVTFEKDNQIKINYSAIFENKAELSKSKTITATLIQMMMDAGATDFLVVPKSYQEDFEKFKTDLDLTGNVWLGSSDSALDDEIYLMLAAVETFIDKDEDGKIPNDFDFNTLQDTLKLKKDGIDDICASAILNASVSKQITQIFHVPTESYQNEVIVRKDLNDLFKAVFLLFDTDEIVVKALDDDLFDLKFKRNDISNILNSVIFRATISNKMEGLNDLSVPKRISSNTTFVDKADGYVVSLEELTSLFEAMFSLFNTDMIMVNDLEQNLTGLELTKNSVDSITSSEIITATVSSKLSDNNQLVILKNDTTEEVLLSDKTIHNVNKEEMNKLLNTVFLLLDTDKIVVNEIGNQFTDLKIAKKDIESILDSHIITATISNKINDMNELAVPLSVINEEITIKNSTENVVQKAELQELLNALFTLLKVETIVVNDINKEFQDISLASQDVESILESHIITATISNKLTAMNELEVPLSVVLDETTIQNTYIIQKQELHSLLDTLYIILKVDTIAINNINMEVEEMSLASEDVDHLFESVILTATISKKLTTNDELTIPLSSVSTIQTLTNSSFYMIDSLELKNLFNAMFVLFETETLSLNAFNTDLQDFDVEPQKLESLLNSHILHTTISKKVIANDELIIPVQSTELIETLTISDFYLIEHDELLTMFNAMFVLFDSNELALNSINTSLKDFDIDAQKVTVLLKSVVIQATISKNFVEVESLDIPEIVQQEYKTITSETKVKIAKEELQAFFDALFATTQGSISGTSFTLDNMSLPTEKSAATTMTNSLIVAATLSNNIMQDDSIVCVIDELKVPYIFQEKISSKAYIEQGELADLLLALTLGMGATDPNNLSFSDIQIPTTEVQKQALVNSEIIRTTISQKVLNQDSVSIERNSPNLDISRHYNGVSVGILSATEILNIVKGIELLNPTNGSFDNLVLDVGQILLMPNKEIVLKTISESDVYLYIISHTLGEDKDSGVKAYQWFTTESNSTTIEGVEYVYQPSRIPGRYNINYPTTETDVFTSFHLDEGQAFVCKAIDILALQYTMQYSLPIL